MTITLDKFIKITEWKEGHPVDYELTEYGKSIFRQLLKITMEEVIDYVTTNLEFSSDMGQEMGEHSTFSGSDCDSTSEPSSV